MAETTTDEDLTGAISAEPTCNSCGSTDVVRDARASWNPETGIWELGQVFDNSYCRACEQTVVSRMWWKFPFGTSGQVWYDAARAASSGTTGSKG